MKSIKSPQAVMRKSNSRMVIEMTQINPLPNPTVAAYRQFFVSRSFRLEEEYPEETEILEIEIKISEGGKTEHEIAELKQNREGILKKWIDRVQEDIRKTKNDDKKRSLTRELDRARSYQHNF